MSVEWLSKPIRVGKKTAPNRIVYQPTEANNCDAEGSPTAYTVKKYLDIARGAPGIIHIESIDVTLATQARSNRMLLLDHNIPGLEKLVAEIRRANRDSPGHVPAQPRGAPERPGIQAADVRLRSGGQGGAKVPVMSTAEVEKVREEFVAAAKRAWKVGADGVDFKQAHSFIGDDFLHPANRRTDKYGGSWENRTRFFREAMKRMREEITDKAFLIGSRISPYEGVPGAFGTTGPDEIYEDLSEPIAFAKLMEKEGIDFINVSAGSAAGNLEILMPTSAYPEGVFRHFSWTRAIKRAVSIPVIGSGYSRLRNGDSALHVADKSQSTLLYWAEKNLRDGNVDLVGVGRQSIADPEFARKVIEGRASEVKWCTTCQECTMLLGGNKRVGCTIYEKEYKALLKG